MPLNHEVRRGIVGLLRDGDRTAGAIADALNRRRPNVSYHLSFLLSHGVVVCRTEGKNRIYSLDTPVVLAAWNAYMSQPTSPALALATATDVVSETLGSHRS